MSKIVPWVVIMLGIFSMILLGMVSSAINRRKAKRHLQQVVGKLPFKLEHSQPYPLILSSGKRYENIRAHFRKVDCISLGEKMLCPF